MLTWLMFMVPMATAPMPVERFVDRIMIEGFAGTEPGDPGVQTLRHKAEAGHVGGVILFGYNVVDAAQLQRLTGEMRRWQVPDWQQPLLIMVDQEGGQVQRLSSAKGFIDWPAAKALGDGDAAAAQDSFVAMAQELYTAGINVNLAPVVDLHHPDSASIGRLGRSFATDGERVAERAALQIAAQQQFGIASVIKHFPGYGSAGLDPHRDLPDITSSWSPAELTPYRLLLQGPSTVAVMTAHVIHRDLEPSGEPLTFSRRALTDQLRGTLGFGGVVMTDDLGMGALTRHFSLDQTILRSLASGHDMLLFGQNHVDWWTWRPWGKPARRFTPIPRLYPRAVEVVRAGLAAGTLRQEELEASAARIARWKGLMLLQQAYKGVAPVPPNQES